MKPEVKAKWVAALRSGEYKQGKHFLRKDDSFCCLGVLCDLHAKETGKAWEDGPDNQDSPDDNLVYQDYSTALPDEVLEWSGLSRQTGDIVSIGTDGPRTLSAHNDRGRTFAQIATAIEEQL